MECIICLNDLSTNDFYNLTCCNNDVHIHCLHNWINSNITNKNISKCFICNQDNDIIKDITSFNYRTHIIIHLDNDELLIRENYLYRNNFHKIVIIILKTACICSLIYFFIFI